MSIELVLDLFVLNPFEPPLLLFEHAGHPDHEGPDRLEPNRLSLRIQPDERVVLRVGLKPPGERMGLLPVVMDFGYREGFGAQAGSGPREAIQWRRSTRP